MTHTSLVERNTHASLLANQSQDKGFFPINWMKAISQFPSSIRVMHLLYSGAEENRLWPKWKVSFLIPSHYWKELNTDVWFSLLQPTTWTTGSVQASWRGTAARWQVHLVSPQPWALWWAPLFRPPRMPWMGCQLEGRWCGASDTTHPIQAEPVRTDNLTMIHTDWECSCPLTNLLDSLWPNAALMQRAWLLSSSIQVFWIRPVQLGVLWWHTLDFCTDCMSN